MSNIDKDKWFNWYKNILLYLKHRDEKPLVELSQDAFIKELISHNLINIKSKNIQVILALPGQKYSTLNNDMRKKVNEVLANDDVDELMYVCDITLVGEKGINNNLTIKRMLKDFETDNPRLWVQIRPYTLFINNLPASSESVVHRRLDQADIKAELETTRTPIAGIPKIKEWDPQVVWLGARSGEIIAVDRLSGSVGYQTILRRVIL